MSKVFVQMFFKQKDCLVPTVHCSESSFLRMSVISKVHDDNSEDGIGFLLPKRRGIFHFSRLQTLFRLVINPISFS